MVSLSSPFFPVLRRLSALALGTALAVSAMPAFAQDAADVIVRLNRMEGQLRQMSGQIEQLQFENRRLTDQLKRFQEDTEFRLSEGRGGTRAPSAAPSATPPQTAPATQQRQRRGDAFDPSAQPDAPGAPRTLGNTVGALSGGAIVDDGSTDEAGPLDLSGVARPVPQAPLARDTQRSGPSVAAAGAGQPRDVYDAAYASVLRKEFEQAEMGFRQFLQSFPRDRLAPDATFWLGETYFQRGRHREAAEQYLKVTTTFSKTPKAPDSLLKLGMSLNALGARDQACSTYAKLERDYPQASSAVRQGVEREQKRARCPA